MRPIHVDARGCPRGLSLIEVLVVVTIVGIVLSLLLPAVQSARESARRVHCSTNLRQLTGALQGFEGQHGALPPGHGRGGASVFVALLPFLERQTLHNSINLQAGVTDVAANATALNETLSVLICPSDALGNVFVKGFTNYAGNHGNIYCDSGGNGVFDDVPAPGGKSGIPLRDVSDGMSNTTAFSEWLTGRADGVLDRLRSFHVTDAPAASESDEGFCSRCRSLVGMKAQPQPLRGLSWVDGRWTRTLFDHGLELNNPFCQRNLTGALAPTTRIVTCPAGSRHPGGACVGFLDGRVSFLSNTISLSVWRAIGSRNLGEAHGDRSVGG